VAAADRAPSRRPDEETRRCPMSDADRGRQRCIPRETKVRGTVAATMSGMSSTHDLDTLSTDELTRAWGGVNMKLTQYGYPGDPYSDSETRHGHGAYRNLDRDHSMVITDSGLRALGLTRAGVRSNPTWVDIKLRGGGTLQRRIDDRAPERDFRADLYQPRGFNHSLPDHADVSLHR
jgi:hypothetical protein